MILEDFNETNAGKFKKTNKTLQTRFGFSISESASLSDLTKLKETADKNIYLLKLNGSTVKSSEELSKQILVVECIGLLIDRRKQERVDEMRSDSMNTNAYREVVDNLSDFVANNVRIGDDIDDAIVQAMKQYRSSEYRYPDMYIENDVRKQAKVKISQHDMPIMQADAALMDDTNEPSRVAEMKNTYIKQLRKLLESEVTDAEIIIATKGFSKSLQEMIEKIGRLQNEDLPPLTDQMRQEHGVPQASSFMMNTQSALQGVMDSLYAAKDEVDLAVQNMASGEVDGVDMDADIAMDPEMSADPELGDEFGDEIAGDDGLGDEIADIEDEFAGDPALAGLEDEPLGREFKESKRVAIAKKIAEMQKQLKQLKESSKK